MEGVEPSKPAIQPRDLSSRRTCAQTAFFFFFFPTHSHIQSRSYRVLHPPAPLPGVESVLFQLEPPWMESSFAVRRWDRQREAVRGVWGGVGGPRAWFLLWLCHQLPVLSLLWASLSLLNREAELKMLPAPISGALQGRTGELESWVRVLML